MVMRSNKNYMYNAWSAQKGNAFFHRSKKKRKKLNAEVIQKYPKMTKLSISSILDFHFCFRISKSYTQKSPDSSKKNKEKKRKEKIDTRNFCLVIYSFFCPLFPFPRDSYSFGKDVRKTKTVFNIDGRWNKTREIISEVDNSEDPSNLRLYS